MISIKNAPSTLNIWFLFKALVGKSDSILAFSGLFLTLLVNIDSFFLNLYLAYLVSLDGLQKLSLNHWPMRPNRLAGRLAGRQARATGLCPDLSA